MFEVQVYDPLKSISKNVARPARTCMMLAAGMAACYWSPSQIDWLLAVVIIVLYS